MRDGLLLLIALSVMSKGTPFSGALETLKYLPQNFLGFDQLGIFRGGQEIFQLV